MTPALEAFSRSVCAPQIATKRSNSAEARSSLQFIPLGWGSDRQTNIKLTSDLGGYVLATFEINDQGLDGVDRSPGNSPPTSNNCKQCPGKAFYNCAFSGTKKINTRRAPEGDHQQRNTVVVKNKFRSPLQLELHLPRCHTLDALNLHSFLLEESGHCR